MSFLSLLMRVPLLGAASPLVTFVVVGVLIAVALYFIPRLIKTMDADLWMLIRIVVIIAFLLWALRLFGVI